MGVGRGVCSELRLVPGAKERAKGQPLRTIRAAQMGELVTLKGIVTKCSDVKPLLQVAAYTCDECGFEIYQVSRTSRSL